jgi:hypothetical protein
MQVQNPLFFGFKKKDIIEWTFIPIVWFRREQREALFCIATK